MSLIMWLKEPGRRGQLLWQLYGEDSETALKALGELRERGWLEDRSLRGVDLREANLPGADLREVDLEEVNLGYADLGKADLSLAELAEAVLVAANLKEANLTETNFYDADLRGADLTGANLDGTLFDQANLKFATVTEEQLRQADALAGAIMPDGSSYDGRFQLEGDLFAAAEQGFDLTDPESMAEFYAIPLEDYQKGQAWAKENLKPAAPPTGKEDGGQEDESEEVVKAVTYSPWNPLDYIRLILNIFKNPDEVLEYRQHPVMRDNLRVMGSWLAATLIYLPGFCQTVYFGLTNDLDAPQSYAMPLIADYIIPIYGALEIVAWALTGWACQQRGRRGALIRLLALLFAFLLSMRASLHSSFAIIVGYIIGLTMLQLLGSRPARLTIFWAAVLRISTSALLPARAFASLVLPVLSALDMDSPGITTIIFFSSGYIWGLLIIGGVRWFVKLVLFKDLGKNNNTAGGSLLIVGYLLVIFLSLLPFLIEQFFNLF